MHRTTIFLIGCRAVGFEKPNGQRSEETIPTILWSLPGSKCTSSSCIHVARHGLCHGSLWWRSLPRARHLVAGCCESWHATTAIWHVMSLCPVPVAARKLNIIQTHIASDWLDMKRESACDVMLMTHASTPGHTNAHVCNVAYGVLAGERPLAGHAMGVQ